MGAGHALEDNTSLKELLELGKKYSKNLETSESAIYVLTELINRHTPAMSKEEKIYTVEAHQILAHTYLSSYFNYTKAGGTICGVLQS